MLAGEFVVLCAAAVMGRFDVVAGAVAMLPEITQVLALAAGGAERAAISPACLSLVRDDARAHRSGRGSDVAIDRGGPSAPSIVAQNASEHGARIEPGAVITGAGGDVQSVAPAIIDPTHP